MMIHTDLSKLVARHAGIIALVIYYFQLVQKCKMYSLLKTPLYFRCSVY